MQYKKITFLIDEKKLEQLQESCQELGLSLDSAFTICANKIIDEQSIPEHIQSKDIALSDEVSQIDHRILKIEQNEKDRQSR